MRKKYKINKTVDKDRNLVNIDVTVDQDLTLFRYRSCNDYSLSAFFNDELWGSTATTFNDPYDNDFVYSDKEVHSYADNKFSEKEIEILAKAHNIKYDSKKQFVKKIVDKVYKENLDTFKRSNLLACFSYDYKSELMWAHYADNGRGFMLEYDFISLREEIKRYAQETLKLMQTVNLENEINFGDIQDTLELYDCYPIIYSNEKFNGTEIMKNIIDFSKEIVSPSKDNIGKNIFQLMIEMFYTPQKAKVMNNTIIYNKNKNWKYEGEWRATSPNHVMLTGVIGSQHGEIGYMRPKAIYLGEFVSNANKFTLVDIAYKKNIKVYQMASKKYAKSRGLRRQMLSKKDIQKILDIK